MMFENGIRTIKDSRYFCTDIHVKFDTAEILLSFCVINCGRAVILFGSIIFIAKCR